METEKDRREVLAGPSQSGRHPEAPNSWGKTDTANNLRWIASAVALLLALFVLHTRDYVAGSIIWIACGALLIAAWPRPEALVRPVVAWNPWLAIAAIGIGGVATWALSNHAVLALPVVFAGPPDVSRGDMLVAINLAVQHFLSGGNPYRLYQVPWEMPLAYGPMLWMPYALPHLLRFDVRVWTLIGQLVVPAACGWAALIEARRQRPLRVAILVGLVIAFTSQPEIRQFLAIGHTQVYWPLLLVFAILIAEERWTGSCVALGLLVAARTPMLSIVPVLLIWLWVRGALTWRRTAVLALSAIGPFVPFLVDAPHQVIYGLYGDYIYRLKDYVWQHTSWAVTTFGITGPLLRHGLGRYVEIVQAAALLIVYGAAFLGLRARQPPLPWMVLALLIFSMTTLWPVLYIYFDVWTLAASGLVAATLSQTKPARFRAVLTPAALLGVVFALVLMAGAHVQGASYSVDIGTPESAGLTGGGFGADASVRDGERTFVWVEGTTARVRLPRAGFRGSRIQVTLRPFIPTPAPRQTVTASLNGRPIGTGVLRDGWQQITFEADRSHWLYGFNVLDLQFADTASASSGDGASVTTRSAGVDEVAVTSQ